MFKIKNKLSRVSSTIWSVYPAIFFLLVGGFSMQSITADDLAQPLFDLDNPASPFSAKMHDGTLSSFYNHINYFEVETEEDEDHHCSIGKTYNVFSSSRIAEKQSGAALLSPKKFVKLFVLYHSWRSHLIS